jgi:UDP-N-acetylmuramoyl-L-alanyl-D-glutamate--2,6-diaminopimelate ligase
MSVIMNIETTHLMNHLHDVLGRSAKVTADSRQVEAGDIFFAYPVGHGKALRDGRDYISAALKNGAEVVVFDPAGMSGQYQDHPKFFAVENLAKQVGYLCAQWYDFPSRQLQVIGVTGTNGKTTITQWLAQALDQPNSRAAVLGTLGSGFPGALAQTGYTTPDGPRLQSQLKAFLDAGAKYIAMEVSSHALEQERVAGLEFNCAVFTNLSQDHLDYHGSMANYAEAKAKLFQQAGIKHAVINLDDSFGRELATQLLAQNRIKLWAYALSKEQFSGFEKFSDRLHCIYAKDTVLTGAGYTSLFVYQGIGEHLANAAVLGEFNLSNCLAVWAVLLTQGMTCEQASKRLGLLRPVAGRMELISLNKTQKSEGPLVVVDYAHTPDALAKALLALRPIASERGGKIWCVFGCGGDRDAGKRPQMGKVVQQYADHIVLTSDNPRSEEPETIISMILSGMNSGAQNIQTVPDRAAAIMAAVRHADAADVVLVAGKGHESTQEIKGKKFDFSDQEHVLLAAGGMA